MSVQICIHTIYIGIDCSTLSPCLMILNFNKLKLQSLFNERKFDFLTQNPALFDLQCMDLINNNKADQGFFCKFQVTKELVKTYNLSLNELCKKILSCIKQVLCLFHFLLQLLDMSSFKSVSKPCN